MAHNIDSGDFRILSRVEGDPPLGVNHTLPAFQPVHIDRPVQQWKVHKSVGNERRLSIAGYPFTKVIDHKVFVSIHREENVEWIITYREHQHAYTIALATDPARGWTTNQESGEIEIHMIKETASLPPQYATSQLFAFEPIN